MSYSPEIITAALQKLGVTVKDGKVSKQEVIAALQKITEASWAEASHLANEKHQKVLDAINEFKEYVSSYSGEDNEAHVAMALKALDCTAHCLSMAHDAASALVHDKEPLETEIEEREIEEIEETPESDEVED